MQPQALPTGPSPAEGPDEMFDEGPVSFAVHDLGARMEAERPLTPSEDGSSDAGREDPEDLFDLLAQLGLPLPHPWAHFLRRQLHARGEWVRSPIVARGGA